MDEDPTQRGLFDFEDCQMNEANAIYAHIFGLVLEDKPLIERLIVCRQYCLRLMLAAHESWRIPQPF